MEGIATILKTDGSTALPSGLLILSVDHPIQSFGKLGRTIQKFANPLIQSTLWSRALISFNYITHILSEKVF